jgi:uracil-DNA glycosylase
MEGVQALSGHDAAASLLRWWRDAGVDVLVEDEPRSWLQTSSLPNGERVAEHSDAGRGAKSAATAPVHGRSAAVPLLGAERSNVALPPNLPDFLAWMRDSAEVPEAGWGRVRILPAGDPAADVMILTDMPEAGDAEAGRLLAGEVGELFDRMLTAIRLSRETVWLAPFASVRKLGRISSHEIARLAEIARHQITLVGPKRLLIMGKTPNEALIGPDWQAERGRFHSLNLGAVRVETIATFHPRLLHERPKWKAEAWKDLQLLIEGLS